MYLNYDPDFYQEGRGINRKNLNENLETPHLAPALFSHLPGIYLKTGILNPSPFLIFISNLATIRSEILTKNPLTLLFFLEMNQLIFCESRYKYVILFKMQVAKVN